MIKVVQQFIENEGEFYSYLVEDNEIVAKVGTFATTLEEALEFKKKLEAALPTVRLEPRIWERPPLNGKKMSPACQYYLVNDNFKCSIGPCMGITNKSKPDPTLEKNMNKVYVKIMKDYNESNI